LGNSANPHLGRNSAHQQKSIMPTQPSSQPTKQDGPRARVFSFVHDESGSITMFGTVMIMMMLLVGGIGVDLIRNEMERTRVQATIDRAVLAAADLDQTLDPEAVVNDYFAKAGMTDYLTSVTVEQGLNFRTVTARARTSTRTQFMRLMGVDELQIPAMGQAEERISNVEISMVLDISGSMRRNSKMSNLKDAAKTFVDTVIRDETDDLISLSLVPYTAQVNAGFEIFDELRTNQLHDFSYCIDFEQSDFSTTSLDFGKTYEHMQHFEEGWNYDYPIGNPACPQQDYEEILPFSQNANILKSRIDDYRARANTSIHLGMKWGVALLDPSFRPITQALSLDNRIDSEFAGRPVNTTRIQPRYYAQPSHYVHWSRYPLYWYLNNYVRSGWNKWRYTKYTSQQADDMLENICDAAKAQGIVVWSVGFEVTNYSADIMENCASSPSHFFRVEGVEIGDAFEAIAKQINQLRLTQ
jgi:Flp pilus assembly protein TadG